MRSLRRFLTRLFNSATRRSHEERLREEIEEHIALQTAENLHADLSPVEARHQAVLKFGGVEAIRQNYRAERGLLFIENLLGDLRNAGRTICRMPGLAAVIIVSLAIGIGVNTTILSWIQMILFQPVPGVSGASNYLLVEPRTKTGGYPGASWLEYRALQTQVPALRDIVAFQMVPFKVGETTPARPRGDRNLRGGFVRRGQTNERDWRAVGVRGHQRAGRPANYTRELGCNHLGHGDWMGTCARDFRSRDYQGRGQPSGFHRCTGDSVGCRDAGLLDSGTES
jgi:hypothetical protein